MLAIFNPPTKTIIAATKDKTKTTAAIRNHRFSSRISFVPFVAYEFDENTDDGVSVTFESVKASAVSCHGDPEAPVEVCP